MTRSATAESMAASTLHVLNRTAFTSFMEKTPRLCLKLLETTMQRLRHANDQIYDLTFLGVRSRIIKTILRLSEQHGISTSDGILIDVKLTHQQLANLVGTVRESVTKVLQELLDDELIHIDKKLITIRNIEAFRLRFDKTSLRFASCLPFFHDSYENIWEGVVVEILRSYPSVMERDPFLSMYSDDSRRQA